MIKHGTRLVPGVALALIPATMAGPASMASPPAAGGSAPVAWVVNQSVRSAAKGSGDPDRHRQQHRGPRHSHRSATGRHRDQ